MATMIDAIVAGVELEALEAKAEEVGIAVNLAIEAIGAAVKAYGEHSAEARAAEAEADRLFEEGERVATRILMKRNGLLQANSRDDAHRAAAIAA